MALSPSAAWYEGMSRANPRVRLLAIIADGTNTWKALDKSCDEFTYPEAISEVGALSARVDPFTREVEIGGIDIGAEDDWLRPIWVNNRLKGQSIQVKIGPAEAGESDFINYFTGIIEDLKPDGKRQYITIKTLDLFGFLAVKKVKGYWINKHPLQAMYLGDGTGILELAGVPTALIDTASFDPSDAANVSIGHWVVSRGGRMFGGGDLGVTEPVPAMDLVRELSQLLGGGLVINEAGQLSFVRFDATASAVVDWTMGDHIINPIEVESTEGKICNKVTVRSHRVESDTFGDDGFMVEFSDEDTDSESQVSYLGGDPRVIDLDPIDTAWINGSGQLLTGISDVDTSMVIYHPTGMAGANIGSGSVPAWAQLTGGRVAYFLISNLWGDENEIVKATACSITSYGSYTGVANPNTGSDDIMYSPGSATYTIVRGQLGTTAQEWDSSLDGGQSAVSVRDITVNVAVVDALLSRFGEGATEISVETSIAECDKQVGDLVTITDPSYVAYGKDGITTSDKWEIVSKELNPASPGFVRWSLVYAAAVVNTRSRAIRVPYPGRSALLRSSHAAADALQPAVVDGLAVSAVVGSSTATVAAGVMAAHPYKSRLASDVDVTVANSQDTWIAYDPGTNSVVPYPVANGAPEPDRAPLHKWLAKVVTDGSGVASKTDLRETLPVPGANLKAGVGMGPLTHLSAAGALDNLTSVTTRSLDSLTDGTYARVLAAGLTAGKVNTTGFVAGAVDSAALGTGAVSTASKVADGAIGLIKMDLSQQFGGRTIVANGAMTMYTRG